MNTKTKTLTLGLSAVLIAGGAGLCTLPQEAQALEKPPVVQKSTNITFKDEVVKKSALECMKKEKLIPEEATEVSLAAADKLTELMIHDEKIKDLSDLAYFPNLTKLIVIRSNISDLTPLKKLVKLQELDLQSNNIKDLTPLKFLPDLKSLDVSSNPIGKNIEVIIEMKNLDTINASDTKLFNCDFLTKLKNPEKYSVYLVHNNISSLPKFNFGTKFKSLELEDNSILDLSPLKNVSSDTVGGGISAYGQRVIFDSATSTYDVSKLPKGVNVSKYRLAEDKDGIKAGIIENNILKPADGEKSGIFSFTCSEVEDRFDDDCELVINFGLSPETPPVPVKEEKTSEMTFDQSDNDLNAPRTPEPFITAGNLIKEIRQTHEQNKAKYTNEQLAALNTKLADYEKQLKAITDSTENMVTRVTKARKLVTELQEMRANPLSVIKGKVEVQKTDKAKDEKTDKSDKKPIDKIEKTDNLHDKRTFDKDKDKGEKQKGKLPKTSDTAPLGVVGLLAGMLGILAVKPKREKL